MQYYYGANNLLRALDEAEFWKYQESEHTKVIQLVTPNLEKEYVDGLNEFKRAFDDTYGNLVKYVESVVRSKGNISEELAKNIKEWIVYSITQSNQFIMYLENMLNESNAVKGSDSSQAVINHIIRESQYFVGIDQLIL